MLARVPFTAVTETQISANFDAGDDVVTDNKDVSVNDCNDVNFSHPPRFTVRRRGRTLNNLVKSIFGITESGWTPPLETDC